MKIPQSVRVLYQDVRPRYEQLRIAVDSLIARNKLARWHYESRLKVEESFALKVETGRVPDPGRMEDFFACTLVVENRSRVDDAERLMCDMFVLKQRRPRQSNRTHLTPSSFEFDDLRLYLAWRDDASLRPTGLDGLEFEVQVKTFLQHAWGIATHDFIYKADDVDWGEARIAFQVKAMLENAELSISEAKKLAGSAMLDREDRVHESLGNTIVELRKRWEIDRLPTDLKRLAQNLEDAAVALGIKMPELWAAVDKATRVGSGAETLDLSPYGAVIAALVAERGGALFDPLAKGQRAVFVPYEVLLPDLRKELLKKVIRTKAPRTALTAVGTDMPMVDEDPAG